MKFEQLAETDTYKQFWAAMMGTENMGFWVLKTQIYIEYRLKHLLVLRLAIATVEEESFIKQFETIQYRHLTLLALAATDSDRLFSYREKLNDVRREVAHRFQVSNYLKALEKFVRAIRRNDPWPPDLDEQVKSVRIALALITTLVEFKIRDFENPDVSDDEYEPE